MNDTKLQKIVELINAWEEKADETDNKDLHTLDYKTLCDIKRILCS